MNEEEKMWYQSRGVVAPLVAAVLAVAAGFGAEVAPGFADEVTTTIMAVGAAFAAVVGIWGRVKAEKAVRFRRPQE